LISNGINIFTVAPLVKNGIHVFCRDEFPTFAERKDVKRSRGEHGVMRGGFVPLQS